MIGLALLAPLSSFAEENGANKKKPNIIYILADDLGISELGCYGQQLIETPNIDRLSQEGMTFSNHYSGNQQRQSDQKRSESGRGKEIHRLVCFIGRSVGLWNGLPGCESDSAGRQGCRL